MSFFIAALALALLVGSVRSLWLTGPAASPGWAARPRVAVPLRVSPCMPVRPVTPDRRAA